MRVLLAALVAALLFPSSSYAAIASYYSSGHTTASGQHFNPMGFTAAHRYSPFGTKLRVCLHGCVVVTVNDRGPFIRGRDIDLSLGAAQAIGLTHKGVGAVTIEKL